MKILLRPVILSLFQILSQSVFAQNFTPVQIRVNHYASERLGSNDVVQPMLISPDTVLDYILNQNWTDSVWVDSRKSNYSFNENGDITKILFERWADSVWVNLWLQSAIYDSSDNLSEFLFETWLNESWEKLFRVSSTHDDNSKLTEEFTENWELDTWVKISLVGFKYDSIGALQMDSTQIWRSDEWVKSGRSNYYYNENNSGYVKTKELWLDSVFVNDRKLTYIFNTSGFDSVKLHERWDTDSWNNNIRELWTYDESDFLTLYASETWSTENWGLSQRTFYTNYDNGIRQEALFQLWNGIEFVFTSKSTYFYEGIVSVEESEIIPHNFAMYQNYPNPFNPVTKIEYTLPHSGDVTLIIYNLLGEEVARIVDRYQQAGEYNTIWNASNMASGIYFYRLQAGDFVQTRKMVLLK